MSDAKRAARAAAREKNIAATAARRAAKELARQGRVSVARAALDEKLHADAAAAALKAKAANAAAAASAAVMAEKVP
jgi:hypothetical protein